MNSTFTKGSRVQNHQPATQTARQSSTSRKRLTLVRQSGSRDMHDRVKMLVQERKMNKIKMGDLESQVNTLNDRLYMAERKGKVTATVGKRQTSELQREV